MSYQKSRMNRTALLIDRQIEAMHYGCIAEFVPLFTGRLCFRMLALFLADLVELATKRPTEEWIDISVEDMEKSPLRWDRNIQSRLFRILKTYGYVQTRVIDKVRHVRVDIEAVDLDTNRS